MGVCSRIADQRSSASSKRYGRVSDVGSTDDSMSGMINGWYFCESVCIDVTSADRIPRMDCFNRYSSPACSQSGGNRDMIWSVNGAIYHKSACLGRDSGAALPYLPS